MTDLVLITAHDDKGATYYLMPASVMTEVERFVQKVWPAQTPRANLGSSRSKPRACAPVLVTLSEEIVNGLLSSPSFALEDCITPGVRIPFEPVWLGGDRMVDDIIITLIGELKPFDLATEAMECAQKNGPTVVSERTVRCD